MGKVGRVALHPLYDLVTRGIEALDKRTMLALGWWIRLLPATAPKIVKPISRTVGVRIYSDASATEEGLAAIALSSGTKGEFTVLLEGKAEKVSLDSLEETDEISV